MSAKNGALITLTASSQQHERCTFFWWMMYFNKKVVSTSAYPDTRDQWLTRTDTWHRSSNTVEYWTDWIPNSNEHPANKRSPVAPWAHWRAGSKDTFCSGWNSLLKNTGSVDVLNLVSLHYTGPLPLLWYVQHVGALVSGNSVLTFSSFMGLAGERVYSGL